MEYDFRKIEKEWQEKWKESGIYKVTNDSSKPKCYVLDMFPYPSGAGLHVGHPLGYIASDIYSRYKRLKGYNVLHPMGYDSFGLPAEQYALETGQHPAVTTEKNITTFRSQLDKIGFCYDWSREVRTSDPNYYKWTQWIFLQLFNSWYNRETNKAEPIATLIPKLHDFDKLSEKEQADLLMNYRLAYCGYGEVNWCEALGTVLANDEVVNGVSERGGYPVVKKKLRQWYLRITEYADRLLEGLERIEFSEAMKDMQTNWIGKSEGAEIEFGVGSQESGVRLKVYTTRPDTISGVDFMVLAPEHELVASIVSAEQKQAVDEYIAYVKSRSERERMAEKKVTGVFTGAYAVNPYNGREVPIWLSEYVLAGYGTGAIMAVPWGDERDQRFAEHFGIPITDITGKLVKEPVGVRKVNYKMRDAAFSRQRYWGEPFPIKWVEGAAVSLDESELPLELPHVDSYKPGPDGEGPLANIPSWVEKHLETNTMPGYAGSSWYFLRYMDTGNDSAFCDRKASDYWGQVDLYIGGTEHAVGHLLYSRMWTKVLYDLGHIGFDEPFKKLVNQGMIQGNSRFVYRLDAVQYKDGKKSFSEIYKNPVFLSYNFYEQLSDPKTRIEIFELINSKYPFYNSLTDFTNLFFSQIHVDVNIVDGTVLDIPAFKRWKTEYEDAEFILYNTLGYVMNKEGGEQLYLCGTEVEKMSKSKYNTVNPDVLVEKYGADTFRMYEMFLGPVEQSKPWDTKGIEGVHRFLKKLWRLFETTTTGTPTPEELKVLHKTIKKIEDDTERFSFNTAVSTFMICVNELTDLNCNKKEILEQLLILLTPYAPHISEELWNQLGNTGSILDAAYPKFEEKYVTESSKEYPVSVNGKVRTNITIAMDAEQPEVEKIILANDVIQKWLEGKQPKKIIFVKGRMINVVV
jgi:leucyl-tRNA synthetase